MATAALTHPFINEQNEVTKDFLLKVSTAKKSDTLKYRSRVVPSMDRRALSVASILREAMPVIFDEKNAEHLRAWALFHSTGRWYLRFVLELPWDNIPQMILDKLMASQADSILKLTAQAPLVSESVKRIKVEPTES